MPPPAPKKWRLRLAARRCHRSGGAVWRSVSARGSPRDPSINRGASPYAPGGALGGWVGAREVWGVLGGGRGWVYGGGGGRGGRDRRG